MPRFAFFESIEVEVLFIRKAGAVEVAGEIAQQVNMFGENIDELVSVEFSVLGFCHRL